jgi:cell pole-organizing protein PopZ
MTAGNSSAPFAIDADRQADPSMEEILASIRKIIADDDAAPPPRRPLGMSAGPTPRETPPPDGSRPNAIVTPLAPPSFGAPRPVAAAVPVVEVPAPPPAAPPEPVRPEPASVVDLGRASAERRAAGEPPPSEPPRQANTAQGAPHGAAQGATQDDTLVSNMTTTSVASAFQALSASVALSTRDVVDTHVREMLRPMLKKWLDDNLPTIVERLVRVEIERVARGGR